MTDSERTPRTTAGRRLLGVAYLSGDAASEGVNLADAILAIEAEAAALPSEQAGIDVRTFLDSLRTPRNSLGKLALPKGPMEWAVEEAWVPPAVEELDDSGDGVMIHRLSELADLIIDRLIARLATDPTSGAPSND